VEGRRFPIVDPITQLVLLTVGIILLGCGAYLAGWRARALLAPPDAFVTGVPTLLTLTKEIAVVAPTLALERVGSRATSTPRPTSVPAPEAGTVIVQRRESGLYDVCRRYCPGIEDDFELLDIYARDIAHLNDLPWLETGPHIQEGQELRMLPCPP